MDVVADDAAHADTLARAAAPPCPFVGARPFEGADKAFFFGRDREARDLATMVAACTLTVVYGPSGAGKSSLLNTRLPDELALIEPDWIVVSFASWQDRFEAPFMAAVRDALATKPSGPPATRVPDIAMDRLAQTLLGVVKETGRPIVLVLDQFEEYFLYHGNGAADFEAGIARLANRRSSPVRIVLSLRSDRLFLLDRLRGRIPDILLNLFLIDRLDGRGAGDAVLRPIEAHNRQTGMAIRADDDVVDAVVQGADEREIFQRLPFRGRGTVSAEPGCPDQREAGHPCAEPARLRVVAPFLQLALEALWHHDIEAGGTRMTLAGLRALAYAPDDAPAPTLVGQLVQQHLDGLLSARSEAEQTVCAKLFDRMVTYAGGKVAVAVPDDFTTVLDAAQLAMAATLLESLASPGPSRLVRRVATDDPVVGAYGGPIATRFEIVHDALAVPILDWVSRWRERRAQQEAAEREQAAAAEALADANAREALERAQREAAEAREAAERERLTAAEAEAREVAERERFAAVEARRRTRIWKVGSFAVLAMLILAGVIGWTILQYQARRDAVERFDTFAENDSSSEYRLRLLLALSSLSEASGPWAFVLDHTRAEVVLRETLERAPRYGGAVTAAATDGGAGQLTTLTAEHGLVVLTLHDGMTRTVLSPEHVQRLLASGIPSASEKLAQMPFLVTGFIAGLDDPALIKAGRLYYRPNGPGAAWQTIDLASLMPEGFDIQPGFLIPDIAAGAVQVTSQNFTNEQRVVRLRPEKAADGTLEFKRAAALPPAIRWRGQRQHPALSPFETEAPHDRYARLTLPPPSGGDGQYTTVELYDGDLSEEWPEQMLWRGTPQLPAERVQRGIDSAGATIDPSVAFAADGSAIVVRIGSAVDIVPLPPVGQSPGQALGSADAPKPISFQAPAPIGDAVVTGRWGGATVAATRAGSTPAGQAVWRVAWLVPGGLAVFDVTEGAGTVPAPRLLLSGLDNAYRLDFSGDGRFAVVQTFPGPDRRTQQVAVWDLGAAWSGIVSGGSLALLKAQACTAAAIERPDGAAFSRDEQITWIGPNGAQPCRHEGRAP